MQLSKTFLTLPTLWNVGLLCLLSISLYSCQSLSAKKIGEFNGRPDLGKWCLADGNGMCEDGDRLRPVRNMFCVDSNKALMGQDHLEKMEFFRWRCLVHGKCI